MNWLHKIHHQAQGLLQKQKLDAEMDEEMRTHIEVRTRENVQAGMPPDEARYAALKQFGWTETIKETCREQRGVTWLEHIIQDLRYGARRSVGDVVGTQSAAWDRAGVRQWSELPRLAGAKLCSLGNGSESGLAGE